MLLMRRHGLNHSDDYESRGSAPQDGRPETSRPPEHITVSLEELLPFAATHQPSQAQPQEPHRARLRNLDQVLGDAC